MTSYFCTTCEKNQTTLVEWQDTSVGYLRNINGDYIDEEDYRLGGSPSTDAFACPECDEDLAPEIIEVLGL